MQTKKRELLTGCWMLLFSAAGFYFSSRLPDSRVAGVGGAGLVPCIATLIMGFFSALKCLSALLGFGTHDAIMTGEKLNGVRCVAVLVLVACYALFLETLGFLIASTCLVLLSLPLFGFRRFRVGIVYAFGLGLVAWILFSTVFSYYLPSGDLF